MDPAHARITRETNRLTTGFASQALETADYLEKLGVPSSRLVAVAFDPRGPNLTLAAARSFRLRYADRPPPAAFNVVSSGIHCRRTWIAYKKLFRGKSAVGVLNFHPEGYTRNNEFDDRPFWMLLADEGLSYLITWIRLTLWPSS